MSIDWDATGNMLQGIGSIAGAVATLAGAAAVVWAARKAANTVEEWHRQKLAERRFDHAEKILDATYRCRDAVHQIRSPLIHAIETENARLELEGDPQWREVDEERAKRLYMGQAMVRRIRNTDKDWDALAECRPLARALFSNELERAIYQLGRIPWLIRVNVDSYVDGFGDDDEFAIRVRKETWATERQDGDAISIRLTECVAAIEDACLPVLRAGDRGATA